METLEEIQNLSLVENGLLHLQFELSRERSSYFRIAREAHLVLYRSMIEALKGSANLAITGRPPKNRSHKYKMGEKPRQEIHRVAIESCNEAWRFSEPEACEKPGIKVDSNNSRQREAEDYLIGFYDALAMIQTECFMGRFKYGNPIPVSDQDMKTLEWLHEQIRNVYEHFVPKSYSAPVQDLAAAGELCLSLSKKLLFESGSVFFYDARKEKLEELFQKVLGELKARKSPER